MSDSTPTAPLRLLKSPFNGEVWTVPPEVTEDMYAHLVNVAGFVPVPVKAEKRKEVARVG